MVRMVVDNEDWNSLQDSLRIAEGRILDLKLIIKGLMQDYDENTLKDLSKSLAYLKAKEVIKDLT